MLNQYAKTQVRKLVEIADMLDLNMRTQAGKVRELERRKLNVARDLALADAAIEKANNWYRNFEHLRPAAIARAKEETSWERLSRELADIDATLARRQAALADLQSDWEQSRRVADRVIPLAGYSEADDAFDNGTVHGWPQ